MNLHSTIKNEHDEMNYLLPTNSCYMHGNGVSEYRLGFVVSFESAKI